MHNLCISDPHCPSGSYRDSSSAECYIQPDDRATWDAARVDCVERGGHLAIVQEASMPFLLSLKAQNKYVKQIYFSTICTLINNQLRK